MTTELGIQVQPAATPTEVAAATDIESGTHSEGNLIKDSENTHEGEGDQVQEEDEEMEEEVDVPDMHSDSLHEGEPGNLQLFAKRAITGPKSSKSGSTVRQVKKPVPPTKPIAKDSKPTAKDNKPTAADALQKLADALNAKLNNPPEDDPDKIYDDVVEDLESADDLPEYIAPIQDNKQPPIDLGKLTDIFGTRDLIKADPALAALERTLVPWENIPEPAAAPASAPAAAPTSAPSIVVHNRASARALLRLGRYVLRTLMRSGGKTASKEAAKGTVKSVGKSLSKAIIEEGKQHLKDKVETAVKDNVRNLVNSINPVGGTTSTPSGPTTKAPVGAPGAKPGATAPAAPAAPKLGEFRQVDRDGSDAFFMSKPVVPDFSYGCSLEYTVSYKPTDRIAAALQVGTIVMMKTHPVSITKREFVENENMLEVTGVHLVTRQLYRGRWIRFEIVPLVDVIETKYKFVEIDPKGNATLMAIDNLRMKIGVDDDIIKNNLIQAQKDKRKVDVYVVGAMGQARVNGIKIR
ncbi:hypothetical protein DFQ27_007306 [Actinomortierella ambigua]|uniref:Uncharacterized protein n=1 Tax=Actinomortierella ambigua TaxID=1343610 RepID=A0A9P6QKD1_9FUNG|nr:hypothetical protein DFQ27_007306 [Actinomortierella ambigua]